MNGVLQSLTFRTETGSGTVTLSAALTSDTGDTLAETESAAVSISTRPPNGRRRAATAGKCSQATPCSSRYPRISLRTPKKALTYSVTGLPDGMTFDPDIMTVSGTAPTGGSVDHGHRDRGGRGRPVGF